MPSFATTVTVYTPMSADTVPPIEHSATSNKPAGNPVMSQVCTSPASASDT